MEIIIRILIRQQEYLIHWKTISGECPWILEVGGGQIMITDYEKMTSDAKDDLINVDIASLVDGCLPPKFVEHNIPLVQMLIEVPGLALYQDPSGTQRRTQEIADFYNSTIIDTDNWRYRKNGEWYQLPSLPQMMEGNYII
jgi:hypothetical protein